MVAERRLGGEAALRWRVAGNGLAAGWRGWVTADLAILQNNTLCSPASSVRTESTGFFLQFTVQWNGSTNEL